MICRKCVPLKTSSPVIPSRAFRSRAVRWMSSRSEAWRSRRARLVYVTEVNCISAADSGHFTRPQAGNVGFKTELTRTALFLRRRGCGGREFGRHQPAGPVLVGPIELVDRLHRPLVERQSAVAVACRAWRRPCARLRAIPHARSARSCPCRRARSASPRGSWRWLRAAREAVSATGADRPARAGGGWREATAVCAARLCQKRKAPVRSRKQAAAPARKRAKANLLQH